MKRAKSLDFLDEIVAERDRAAPGFAELVEQLTDARIRRRRTPVLACCPLCDEPFEVRAGALGCACSREPEPCACPRVDFLKEESPLTLEDLVLLGERFVFRRSVAEAADARGLTREELRLLEARAMGRWKKILARELGRRTA